MSSLFDLTGKVAIITGASSGIGTQLARAFAREGADVAILARRYEKLEELSKEIESMGRKVLPVKCDVTNEENVRTAVKEVMEHFGKIDILVNNAGVAAEGAVDSITEEEWDKVYNTNVKGVFFMTKHVAKVMIERKYGKIVNLASIYGITGSKTSPVHAYQASKGAIVNLTRGLAAYWGKFGITVNAVGPSLFETEMTQDGLFEEQNLRMYNALVPLGRPGKPGELDGAVIYFASDASSYTTGQTLFVDGGWTSV